MSNQIYENKKEKYENEQSSAHTLIFVGAIGIIIEFLNLFGIIRLPISGQTKYVFYIAMTLMFIIFIVLGLYCKKRAAQFKSLGDKEDSLENSIKEWIKSNISSVKVDASIDFSGVSDETERYMLRVAYIKDLIKNDFPDGDDLFIEHLVEEAYDDLF